MSIIFILSIIIFYTLKKGIRMQTNLWNLKSSKERLGIREKTQAHKRHLISLVNVKSKFKNSISSDLRKSNFQSKIKTLNGPYKSRVGHTISKENRELADRLLNINHSGSLRKKFDSQHHFKFVSITQNLKMISDINRSTKFKQIEHQNSKMFHRLVNTSPTLSVSRQKWVRDSRNNLQYRSNMSKSKYQNPDYSIEVSRLLEKAEKNKKVTYKHLQYSMVSDQLPNLNSILKNSTASSNKDSLPKDIKMRKMANKVLLQKPSHENSKAGFNRHNLGNKKEKSSFNTSKLKGSKNNSVIHSFRG